MKQNKQKEIETNLNNVYPYNFILSVYGDKYHEIQPDEPYSPEKLEKMTPVGALFFIRDAYTADERRFIEAHFRDGKSYVQIGEENGITAIKARNITENLLRIARNPKKTRKYRVRPAAEYDSEHKEKLRLSYELNGLKAEINSDYEYRGKSSEIDIDKLGLSTRSFNSLKRGLVFTIADLTSKRFPDKNSLKRVRSLGSKGCDEIIEKVHQYGEKMYWEKEESQNK